MNLLHLSTLLITKMSDGVSSMSTFKQSMNESIILVSKLKPPIPGFLLQKSFLSSSNKYIMVQAFPLLQQRSSTAMKLKDTHELEELNSEYPYKDLYFSL